MKALLKLAKSYRQFLKFAKHPSGGILFFCPEDRTVLLAKRSKEMSSPGTWDIQGGRFSEGDNSSFETAVREAKEEIRNLPSKKKFVGKYVLPTPDDSQYIIYLCAVSKKEKKKWSLKIDLDYENDEFKWFDIDNLPKNTHLPFDWVSEKLNQFMDE